MKKEVDYMKGIYLNDIPMDLFIKYFTKEDLQDGVRTPSLINDTRTFYRYEMTIAGSGTFFLFSRFHYENDEESLLSELYGNMLGKVPNLLETSITSANIELLDEDTIESGASYINERNFSLNVYAYNFKPLSQNLSSNYYIGFRNYGQTNYFLDAEFSPTTEYEIVDLRDNSNAISLNTAVNIISQPEQMRYAVIRSDSSNELLGYLFKNERYRIQEQDAEGRFLFINDSGIGKTNDEFRKSNFLRHNSAIRKGFLNIVDPIDLVRLRFVPGVVGMYKKGEEKKLVFFQSFTRKKKYTIQTLLEPGISYSVERLSNQLKDLITAAGASGHSLANLKEYRMKEILNTFKIPKIKVQSFPSSSFRVVDKIASFTLTVNSVVILNYMIEYAIIPNFNNTTKFLITRENNKLKVSTGQFYANYQIIKEGTIHFIKLPVNSESSVMIKPGLNAGVTSLFAGQKYINYNSRNYTVYKDPLALESSDLYYNGYVLFPVDIGFYEDVRKSIGSIASITNTSYNDGTGISDIFITLGKYDPTLDEISINQENFDLAGYQEIQTGSNYKRTYYVRDEINRLFITKVEEIIERDALPSQDQPTRKEFLDFSHLSPVVQPSGTEGTDYFKSPDGSFLKRSTAVSASSSLSNFEDRFKISGYYVDDGYFSSRGEYIPNLTNGDENFEIVSKMFSDLSIYSGSDFLNINNIFYDNKSPIKMKVYSEAFKNIVINSKFESEKISKRNSSPSTDRLKRKIVLEKTDLSEGRLLTKGLSQEEISKEKILVDAETNRLNSFQKVLNYKNVPYDKKGSAISLDQRIREKVFSMGESKKFAFDDIINLEKNIKINENQRIYFKPRLIKMITDMFFDSVYTNENYIINSYYKYVKEKMDIIDTPVIKSKDDDVAYKEIYTGHDDENLEDIITKIMSREEDWRIL
jgi:hypothetical protein